MPAEQSPPNWRPSAAPEVLRLRASLLGRLRAWFAERGILEVETPVLSRGASTDVHIQSLRTRLSESGGTDMFLHTSPEFAMKRLLAAGVGDIYQVCRVFRQGEAGRRHNPEFTMVEFYRVGLDHHGLMAEVESLLRHLLHPCLSLGQTEKLSYRDACLGHGHFDPFVAGPVDLAARLDAKGIPLPADLSEDRAALLDLAFAAVVAPVLGQGRLTFVFDFPGEQAALARLREGNPVVAERVELFLEGMELGNGFHELADAAEQRARFCRDNDRRRDLGLPQMPLDEHLLDALEHGFPDCSGIALGLDRILMLAAGAESIEEVLSFPVDRA